MLTLLPAPVLGSDDWRTLAVDFGQSTSNSSIGRTSFDLYLLGLQREFGEPLLAGKRLSLEGYYEGSFNYWNAQVTDVYALAFGPVLAHYLRIRSIKHVSSDIGKYAGPNLPIHKPATSPMRFTPRSVVAPFALTFHP